MNGDGYEFANRQDPNLSEKLKAEYSGILRLGCLQMYFVMNQIRAANGHSARYRDLLNETQARLECETYIYWCKDAQHLN